MITAIEVKHALRKMDFPFSAQFALSKIEELLTSSQGRARNFFMTDLALELIAEFVFNEVDWQGHKKKNKLTCLQELQLLHIICDFLTLPGVDEARKNAVFLLLFNYNDQDKQDRSRLLVKLVSLAVSLKNSQVLKSIAIQMQQLSCASKFSLQVSQALVNDYFVMLPQAVNKLKELPKVAPLFTANFMTAVSEIYYSLDKMVATPPPIGLLKVITDWVLNYDNLCITALVHDLKPSLPLGAIPMPAIAPFGGLLKWCVLSPLYETDEEALRLYSQLHLKLTCFLLDHDWSTDVEHNIISVQSFITMIFFIKQKGDAEESKREQSIDRLAQCFHFALFSHIIYGNLQDFVAQCQALTYNRLMKIVLDVHNVTSSWEKPQMPEVK